MKIRKANSNYMNIEWIVKALANRRRLAIVQLLAQQRGLTVEQIALHLRLSIKATSKHLVKLSRANILEREQISLFAYYRLRAPLHPIASVVLASLNE